MIYFAQIVKQQLNSAIRLICDKTQKPEININIERELGSLKLIGLVSQQTFNIYGNSSLDE